MEDNKNPMLGRFAEAPAHPGDPHAPEADRKRVVPRLLGLLTLATMLGVLAGAGGAMTRTSEVGWVVLVLATMGLWAIWLLWRASLTDPGVPVSRVHPFLAIVLVVLLVHLFGSDGAADVEGRIDLMGKPDPGVLIRLMIFGLLLMLVQDVLPRAGNPRWVLTAAGLLIALGATAQLQSPQLRHGAQAAALVGLVGVGVFLTPTLLPLATIHSFGPIRIGWLLQGGHVVRLAVGATLATLILTSHYQASAAGVVAAIVVGATLIGSGLVLTRHRLRFLTLGVVLAGAGAVGLRRLGLPELPWLEHASLFGAARWEGLASATGLPGAGILVLTAGWFGAGLLLAGFAASMLCGLWAARSGSASDQTRSAMWAAVAALSAAALLGREGLAVPATVAVAALTWGLLPHMMGHRTGRFTGWPVTLTFLALLMMLGLQQRLAGMSWVSRRATDDSVGHFAGTFLLAMVLLWQMRSRRWWQGLLCALVAGVIASLGELAQRYLSIGRQAEWRDVAADMLGAGAAMLVFAALRTVLRVEHYILSRPTSGYERYEP